jgi:hypothetical protein
MSRIFFIPAWFRKYAAETPVMPAPQMIASNVLLIKYPP